MSKGLFRPENYAAKFFTFRSHCLSKLLFSTIAALVVISTAHAAGPLHVNPANPRYFLDSNGTAVYLAGTYLRHEEIELGTSDFTAYLDFLQQQKHNFTRLWAWEQTPSTARNPLLTLAYERTGPGLALDGGAKFDLRRFNQNHFDQLRARVVQAAQRGVYVSVVLFQSLNATSKKQQDNPWYANPLNRDNNINGINGDTNGNGVGDEAFTLAIPAITTLQEAYIRKVVDTLNNLDNVLYEISADGPLGNPVWQNYIINYLKTYQATKLNQHPIGIGYMSGTNTEDVFAGPADWIAVYGADLNPPLAAGAKVLFLEANPSLLGDGSSYQSIWKYFTRGFNVIDRELDSLTPGISDGLHRAITQSLAYSQILNLAAMIPSDVICSSGYCLVKPGAEYLAYLPLGGRLLIDLSTAQQSFLVNWFNPITGQTVSGNTASGGGQVTLTSPFNGEALLHLKIQPQALTSASTTTNTSDTSNVTTLSTSYSASTTSTGSKKTTVSTPTITPNGGTITPNGVSFAGSISVSLADATDGATIYYTTDGSAPGQSAKKYSGPITISSDVLLKAQALKNNANPSSVASAWFAKTSAFDFSLANSGNVSVVAGASISNKINATLASGSSQALSFTVSGLPSGASGSFSSTTCNPSCSTVLGITTSGSTPAGNFPVTVTSTSTGGDITRTTVFTLNVAAAVVSTVATPTITPNGGSFTNSVSVTLATATSGAQIYYTTDGSSPTQSSKLYTGAMTLTASAVVKAKTFKSGYNPSAEATASFTSNLVAYWKFDEGTGTTTADSSGNGNTGSLVNGPVWTTGRVGNALYFDGIDDNVTVPDSASLNLSSSFTLSAWVNPASTFTDYRSIFAKNYKYYLYASSTGFCGDGNPMGGFYEGQDLAACQASPLPFNTWTHLVVTYNGSSLILYRNGVAVATYNVSATLSPTTGTLQIGASQFGEYFKGLIDEVRVYKTALSDTEIQTIYQQESIGISSTVAAPLISPNGGSYSGSVSVAMQTATAGASIYYTTDGSTPTQSSTLYSGSVALASSKIVKTKAFKSGYNASSEATASFTIVQPFDFSLGNSGDLSVIAGASVSNTITATLASGSTQALSFTVSGLPSGASGSFSSTTCNPSCSTLLTITTSSSTPAGNFPVTVTSTGGGLTRTTVFTLNVAAAVVSTVATPTITPNGGSFTSSVSVSLATATSAASIYYTTDGSSPTPSSKLYTGPMTLTSSAVVKAKAFKSGYNPSTEASASFTSDLVAYWKFDEGTGTTANDSSGNGNTGTLVNGPQWTTGVVGKALLFDGNSHNVTVLDSNSLNLSDAFTLSAWVNPASAFTDFRSILAKNYKYYLYASSTGFCGDGSPLGGFFEGSDIAVCQASLLPANTWTHLTATYDGSTLTMYRNGVAAASSAVSTTLSPTNGTLQIAASEYGEFFKGAIDEVRIYKRALNTTEIQNIYQQSAINLPFDYAISNSGDRSANAGSSVTETINTTLTSGASQPVSFSISGLPSGGTGSFSSTSCTPACSTILTIMTGGATPAGAYPITVTSTGGGLKKSTTFILNVAFAFTVATPTITPNGGTFPSSVSVTFQSATSGSSIYYTTDGSTPTQTSTLYTEAMTLTNSATVNAKAFMSGYNPSAVASASFTNSSSTVTSKVYYVATTGSDSNGCTQVQNSGTPKRTIIAALACVGSAGTEAGAGNTVQVAPGIYSEALIDKIPSGSSWNAPFVLRCATSRACTITPGNRTGIYIGSGSSHYIEIRGFVVDGQNNTSAVGMNISGYTATQQHDIRIVDNEIKNLGAMGIQIGGGSNIDILQNSIHDLGFACTHFCHGIYPSDNTTNVVIDGNEIFKVSAYGVHVYGSTPSTIQNIIVRKNILHDNGLAIDSGGGILMGGTNSQVNNNISYNNAHDGIILWSGCASVNIYNNTSYNNSENGIFIYNCNSANIRNNLVVGNRTTQINNNGSNTTMSNNVMSGTAGSHFVDPASGNFNLIAKSTAIDAGTSFIATGISMPYIGSAPDAGGLESPYP